MAGGVLALGLTMPKEVTVRRSVTINATADAVKSQAFYLHNWENWCSMIYADTSANISISGADGQAGSKLSWIGREGTVGTGELQNTGISDSAMSYSFVLREPGSMVADGRLSVVAMEDSVRVVWTFHKEFPFPSNAALIVFNLDKYIGGDFEVSLKRMKAYIESAVEPLIPVSKVVYNGVLVAGVREKISERDCATFAGDSYNLLRHGAPELVRGNGLLLVYERDTLRHEVDVMAALMVTDSVLPVKGVTVSRIDTSEALRAVVPQNEVEVKRAHQLLERRARKMKLETWMRIEEYVQDGGKEQVVVYHLVQ